MMESGEQCAVSCGVKQMPQLYAGSLDTLVQVYQLSFNSLRDIKLVLYRCNS